MARRYTAGHPLLGDTSMLLKRLCLPLLVIAVLSFSQRVHARSPADIPVADFFRRPMLQSPTLSPDGTRVAMVVPGPDGRTVLAVADVSTPDKRTGIARFGDADVQRVWWVNDKRLLFNAIDYQSALGEQFGGGLYAVDTDGSDFVWLVGRGALDESKGHMATRPLRWNHRLLTTLRDGSDDILVERLGVFHGDPDFLSSSPLRVNTRTRATQTLVQDAPPNAAQWALNAKGEPLSVLSTERDSGLARVWWRATANTPWTELASYDIHDPASLGLQPIAVGVDGQLLVRALRQDAARTAALYRYDPRARELSPQPLLALKDFDFDGTSLVFNRATGALVGAQYNSDAVGVAWLDPGLRDVQRRIDTLLPTTSNVFTCDPCTGQRRFVVVAWSDRQAPVYFVFDREVAGKDALKLLGASRPSMDSALMAVQDLERVPTRDGKSMPVYVTKPKGKGPWPTMILVHGGPWVRGASWGWNSDSQFLASRGYLVVEPEFRGSTGHGHAWFFASMKQWGLTMQDDVTDATRWAIDKGLADAKRIAIAGASYGGYAAMMGLVKEPDLYRAGINWVGVTDIELMYSIGWSDLPQEWLRLGMPRMIGDPVKDRAQLRRTSPLHRASEITKPVLMAYGGMDRRVPLPHGTQMRDALIKSGKAEVEWVEYELEGHGFLLEKNRVDFWTRVERFLVEHLR